MRKMSENDISLSHKANEMIDKIRRIAKDRKKAEQEAFDKKAAKYRRLLKQIRSYSPEMVEVSTIVRELVTNELISLESDLICSSERRNIACSASRWRCFGGYNILPDFNGKCGDIEPHETSLFYDFVNERFCICKPYTENVYASCTDEWLVKKCVECNSIASALNDIATGFKAYKKKVLKFVDNLR